eukprot:403364672
MGSDICTQQTKYCGNSTVYNATNTTQYLQASGFYYDFDSPCFYTITADYSDTTSKQEILIFVNYMFATDMYIGNGTSPENALNLTTLATRKSYKYQVKLQGNVANKIYLALWPDQSKTYAPIFNISYKLIPSVNDAFSLIYLSDGDTVSDYTGEIYIPSVVGPFITMLCVVIGIIGAYYSNKLCTKDYSNINPDYLTAGEKQIDKKDWALIEMTMLKAGINQPPKNAPKEFQLEYLEKVDEIRRLERLDESVLLKARQQQEIKNYFDKQNMDIDTLEQQADLNVEDQQRIIEGLEQRVQTRQNKLNIFRSGDQKQYTTHGRFTTEPSNNKLNMLKIQGNNPQSNSSRGNIPIR